MPKRIGPEVKIITLFTALPDDSKRIVLEIIRSQTASTRAPKPSVQGAGKRSPRSKSGEESKVSTGDGTVAATTAAVCAVPNCGLPEWAPIHSKETADYHIFRAAIKTRGAGV